MVFAFFSGRIGMGGLAGEIVRAGWERKRKKEKEKEREARYGINCTCRTALVMRRKQMICLFVKPRTVTELDGQLMILCFSSVFSSSNWAIGAVFLRQIRYS